MIFCRMLYAIVALVAVTALSGCPGNQAASGPVATCEKAGQQCKLGGGQLGVCAAGANGELECQSQH